MRIRTTLSTIAVVLSLAACTYVERTPQPTVVQTPPTVVTPAPSAPPTVTVRPGY